MELKTGHLLAGGRYRVERVLGQGGFGITYEARDTLMDCTVAIKEFFVKDFCNRSKDTDCVIVATESKVELIKKLRAKFVEEAQALYRMNHHGIVRVTNLIEENNTAYYVMDYISGNSLGALIEQCGKLSETQALGYIRQVAEALRYVHSKNRLHLDIKPQNIMIDSCTDRAVLIDFGVSKQYDEVNGENTSTLLGCTPGYAPIEQSGSGVAEFYPSTDIYALGATLYKALTGKTPLPAHLLACGDSLEPLPDGIGAVTRKAVETAMCLNRNKRPQSIGEFLALLENGNVKTENGKEDDDGATVVALDNKSSSTPVGEVARSGGGEEAESARPAISSDSKKHVEDTVIIVQQQAIGTVDSHEYVDLGLSVKWATCNVGASTPEEYGDYYAWGELEEKSDYSESEYIYSNRRGFLTGLLSGEYQFQEIGDEISGTEYDVVRKEWGEKWRLPTKLEFQELVDNCTREWTTQGHSNGYKFTSKKNGNSIFIPAAGWCCGTELKYKEGTRGNYWTASSVVASSCAAYILDFDNTEQCGLNFGSRSDGCSVRPVSD